MDATMTETKWLPLIQAREELFDEPRPSYQALMWWIHKGSRGVFLRCRVRGARYFLCREDIEAFHRECGEVVMGKRETAGSEKVLA